MRNNGKKSIIGSQHIDTQCGQKNRAGLCVHMVHWYFALHHCMATVVYVSIIARWTATIETNY